MLFKNQTLKMNFQKNNDKNNNKKYNFCYDAMSCQTKFISGSCFDKLELAAKNE